MPACRPGQRVPWLARELAPQQFSAGVPAGMRAGSRDLQACRGAIEPVGTRPWISSLGSALDDPGSLSAIITLFRRDTLTHTQTSTLLALFTEVRRHASEPDEPREHGRCLAPSSGKFLR